MSIIFETSIPGRCGVTLPEPDVPEATPFPNALRRAADAPLCELSELDVVRHFSELSRKNFSVDNGFYPLGSCTMKYNPKVCEKIAALEGFCDLHPFLPQLKHGSPLTQGALQVLYALEHQLCEICGMDAFTLQPLAGAHGELTGMMLVAAYHRAKGEVRTEVLIPDEAHGTNPASAAIAGFETRSIPTDPKTGMLDLDAVRKAIHPGTAAVMLTNPNTLGIFNSNIQELVGIAHEHDVQVYYGGANLNAVMGRFRPGDAGVDVLHVNLHKTFATPHGGGGPGAGPVGVRAHLEPFLPISRVVKRADNTYGLDYDRPQSIGYIAPFYGSFLVCLKAYAYILMLGAEGLRSASEHAVLNANYLMNRLRGAFELPFDRLCKHEFVMAPRGGGKAVDVAKALIDRGFHPPTVHFPLIVREALMVEPTETESPETLDAFAEALLEIAKTLEDNPAAFATAPETTAVSRPDEVRAAREPDLAYSDPTPRDAARA